MTIADTGKDEETRWVVTTRVVWPEDKDGNIIKPSWWGGRGNGAKNIPRGAGKVRGRRRDERLTLVEAYCEPSRHFSLEWPRAAYHLVATA
ncbi:MAG: hypothetical protein WAK55_16045 [Xanthobacteraceae bacterium]